MSGVFKSLRDEKEEMEVRWFAGWFSSQTGRQARYFLRGLQSQKTTLRTISMGAMPALPIGAVISADGSLLDTRAEGVAQELKFDDLGRCEDIPFEGHVPKFLYSLDGHRGWDQRILRYQLGNTVCLIPAYELIRYFFCLNRTLTHALLEPSGLFVLAVCPPPGVYDEAEINFTEELPVRVLSQPFVQEFAWLSIDPGARRAWDSVLELSARQRYLTVRPPSLAGTMVVRGNRKGHIIFVQEIVSFRGRRHPCKLLEYSHPMLASTDIFPPPTPDEGETPRGSIPPFETKRVIDGSQPARWNISQSAIQIGRQYSAFTNDVRVTKRRIPRAEADEFGSQPSQTKGTQGDEQAAPFGSPAIDRNAEPRQRPSCYSLDQSDEHGTLQPLELSILPETVADYAGETRALAEVVNLIAMVCPDTEVSMSFCFLKNGRKFSNTDRGRRACLVALFRIQHKLPVVLLDVDHTGLAGLSGLLMGYKRDCVLAEIESHIQTVLDALVHRGGKWDVEIENAMSEHAEFQRLPWVARRQGVRQRSAFKRDWARKIIDKIRAIAVDRARDPARLSSIKGSGVG